MYERFTDHARNVMKLANQETQRFHHKYIGTEYILLGLIADAVDEVLPRPSDAHSSRGAGPFAGFWNWISRLQNRAASLQPLAPESLAAGDLLKKLGLDLRKIRPEVEKIVQSGAATVTTSKLPQTPRAKKVIEYAMEEARSLKHNYVGTEHLLLGLLREHEGIAAQALMNLGVTIEEVRDEVHRLDGRL
jgi:ATP-dependent Clp protease ATP-binding subunit ClpC